MLKTLEDTLKLLIKISDIGDYGQQLIIIENGIDFMKNILSCPEEPYSKHIEISSLTWQLVLSLASRNRETQRRIWDECNELFLHYLHQHNFRYKDFCRLVVHEIYAFDQQGRLEGTGLLKCLLNSFHREKRAEPMKEQPLTLFLRHFITSERNILTMYPQLTIIEKIAILQFTVDYMLGDDDECFPVSVGLLLPIFYDFISKSEQIFNSYIGTSSADDLHIQELFALFEVVTVATPNQRYRLNTFDFQLVLNVGRLLSYVLTNEEVAVQTFSAIKRNPHQPLKLQQLILTTISNLVKGNEDHKEKVKETPVNFRMH